MKKRKTFYDLPSGLSKPLYIRNEDYRATRQLYYELRSITFVGCEFRDSLIKYVSFTDCKFISCNFRKTEFTEVTFIAVSFDKCRMRYTTFEGCRADGLAVTNSIIHINAKHNMSYCHQCSQPYSLTDWIVPGVQKCVDCLESWGHIEATIAYSFGVKHENHTSL